MSTPFEDAMNNLLWGCSTKTQSKNLRKIAEQITKVPKSFNIPSEYITEFPTSSNVKESKK